MQFTMSEYDEFSADFPQHGFESHIGEHIVTGRHDIDLPGMLIVTSSGRPFSLDYIIRLLKFLCRPTFTWR